MFFLPTPGVISDVGELRSRYKALLTESEQAPVYLLRHNQPQAVLLSMTAYCDLLRAAGRLVGDVAPDAGPAPEAAAPVIGEAALGTAAIRGRAFDATPASVGANNTAGWGSAVEHLRGEPVPALTESRQFGDRVAGGATIDADDAMAIGAMEFVFEALDRTPAEPAPLRTTV